ncbi:DUF4365 domain-containing protein [Nocardia amamiensis]|uniref:DUF4365 domain-containing protein n=1 Tax=Nocardia amamiensis TaxID=404578 RepID=A0ABS0CR16_9NOCA|nr:DUF4365 domain-containing protein [Nocardia amamiensis]MBF6299065.1 DUF4365 domain-containing protein [Nocardia amamiensis]
MSIAKLQRAFLSVGWTVEELHKDYGEDLQVRIFHEGEATPYLFFVQAKHVANAARYRTKDGRYISYPFERQHLEIWEDFSEPVILTLWDVETDQIYWDMAQSLEWPPTNRKTRQCTVRFPSDNILDQDGLERIEARTIHRASRFEIHKSGTDNLIQRFQELFDVEIDYDAHHEYLSVTLPNGEVDFTYFGTKAVMMQKLEEETGLEPTEIFQKLMAVGTLFALSAANDVPIPVRGRNGAVEVARGIDELMRIVTRNLELIPERNPEVVPAHVLEYLKSPDDWVVIDSLIQKLT